MYQEDVWASESRTPNSPQFNVVLHERLRGRLDLPLFRACVADTLREHDAFRMRFLDDGGVPFVRVEDPREANIPVETVDLSGEDDPAGAVLAWREKDLYRPLDQHRGGLVRAALLVEDASVVHLHLKAHHIVADAWALNQVSARILAAYRRRRDGGPEHEPAPPAYTDEFARTRAYTESRQCESDRRFHRRNLEGFTPVLFPRSGTGRTRRGRHSFTVDGKTVQRILEAGGSPMSYLAAALGVWLGRVLRASEVAVGVPFLNRRTDTERHVVGHLANNLPLRLDADESRPLLELAEAARARLREMRDHERLPLSEIVKEMPTASDGARRPFDVTLSYLRYPHPSPGEGIERRTTVMAPVHEDNALSIMVHAFEDEDDLRVDLDYARDVFDGELTAEAFAGHITELVAKGLDMVELPVSALSMLTGDEYEDLVRRRQGEHAHYPREKTVHGLFQEQAALTPERLAVQDTATGAAFTFAELDRRSNQVARGLRDQGVGPGSRVAVMAERGPELLPGLLGILKAGGAYVPVDPGYPGARIELLLDDCAPAAVLTSRGVGTDRVPPGIPVHRVAELYRGSDRPLAPSAQSTDVAYVIYTSGSTGRPKGVMVEHHSVINRLAWMQRHYPIGRGDTLLQKTPVSFDVSVWELFWWGVEGARLAMLPPGAEKDPRRILEAVAARRVSALHFVPSMLGPFLDMVEGDSTAVAKAASLRWVFCSGEALPAERVNQFNRVFAETQKRGGGPVLVNLYGPTEAAVDVTRFDCPPATRVDRVPIGRPVQNTSLYVLGAHGGPQPVGVPGELCIGGVQVARGYLNRPELTDEKFIKDPYSPGGRLYRTGDLARLLSDGNIEYLGRIDDQVKIRGNRVELGEVQNALVSLEEIREAVVIDHTPPGRGTVLVAYYVADAELDPGELSARLGASLPDYMIPARHVRLDRIPLTPNGKADRRALPRPSAASPSSGDEPHTPTEAALADVIGEVLGLGRVGVEDDYYALGGDSITMLRIRALAERAGVGFDLSDLVRNPTVRGLAAAIGRRGGATAPRDTAHPPFALVSHVDRARLEGRADAFPVTRLQLGLLFHSRRTQESAVYKDVFRYSIEMPWDARHLRAAFDRLVARHPVLRSSFALTGYSEPLQIVDRHAPSGGLETTDLRGVDAREAEERIIAHMRERRRHDYVFERPPLYLFHAFVTDGAVELVFSFHHALLDGGSVANLVSELLQDHLHSCGLDVGPVAGGPLPSPALHAADERAAISSADGRAFWRGRLAGAAPPNLEGFRSHEPPEGDEMIVREVRPPDDLLSRVRALVEEHRVPIKSVLFAAHALTLSAMAGQDDLCTGLVAHGRPDVEDGERVCGLFLNTLPMRVSPTRGTWIDAVHHVAEAERAAYPHRRVPLEVIQQDQGGATLVDTAFNYVHFRQLGEVLGLTGVRDRGFTAWEETNFTLLVNAMTDPVDGRVRLRMDFSGQTFTAGQADLFAASYTEILRRIAERPLEEADPSFLAPAPSSPPPRPAPPVCVVRSFEERAEAAPDATAVVSGDDSWSYARLAEVSERVARALLSVGVRPGDRVGIALERGPRAVAVLLGVARAGCSAVPLDVTYPAGRLREMVEQGAPKRVVVAQAYEHLIDDGSAVLVAESLLDGSAAPAPDRSAPLPRVSPEDEAYLLFTSGSTGTPKGVAMPHRSLANLVAWQNSVPSGAVGGRTLQYAPLSFDVSFQEVYSTLCGGGTLVVIPEDLRRDVPGLLRHIDEAGVERVFMPYVALQRLAEAATALGVVPRSLRVIASSGEQLRITPEIRGLCRSLGEDVVLENQYGPTESHVVTVHTLDGDPARFPALPPVGRPVDGARVLVLDPSGRPAPVGGKGEIHLGGACLASGYAGRPDLTRERFVADPTREGERLYRTGDIGMVLPGGEVVCLGRSDRQVKVRGYRVEPAEVEIALAEAAAELGAEAVEVAVVARTRAAGETFLAAYAVSAEADLDVEALRRRLRAVLPEYMVPAHVERITAMPMTPSGKRDDAALGRRPLAAPSRRTSAPPSTAEEQVLADMLGDLLGRTELGVHDNLFDAGATSITAMRLAVLVEQRFGTPIPLSRLIAAPTIAELARELPGAGDGERRPESGFDPLVRIREGGDAAPLFYVHPMGGNVLCYVPFAQHLPDDRPLYALQAFGADAGTEPVRGMEEIARRYIEAMRRVRPEGPYHIGGWSFGGFVAFEMARQLRAEGHEVGSLVVLDTTALGDDRSAWVDDNALIAWFFWELLWLERGGDSPEAVIPDGAATLDEKFEYITRLAVDEGVLPPGSTDSVVRRLFRLYEANWRSAFEYWPEVVDQDMLLVRARRPLPEVLLSMHTAIGSMHADAENGWRERTSGRLSVVEVEGDHLTIMEEPYVADVVTAVLDAVEHPTGDVEE
ncbi:amino acid adenylation domain-containing protein [Nocardiopsis sp. EMB25]|uniref:amino acid adenylation domain-containing protein n=1 Tax=Nocardiopsis sp. EMB25 TaxID=2835867 RepID=UPI002284F5FE|nr:non-ribosomal peptide synthetase [Nocardiopsis sp. EMB25]MCY9785275.1 amino acid adenylation domain-containing protein [Nocardiopsis sp. EMB25]